MGRAYVLAANQYHRDLPPSQRAAVAANLVPNIAEFVNQKRIAKIRQARLRKLGGESLPLVARSPEEGTEIVSSRQIAADRMEISDTYVGDALRVKREAPERFAEIFAGKLTVKAAIVELDGVSDDPYTRRVRAARSKLNTLLKTADDNPEFLDRLETLLAQFAS